MKLLKRYNPGFHHAMLHKGPIFEADNARYFHWVAAFEKQKGGIQQRRQITFTIYFPVNLVLGSNIVRFLEDNLKTLKLYTVMFYKLEITLGFLVPLG